VIRPLAAAGADRACRRQCRRAHPPRQPSRSSRWRARTARSVLPPGRHARLPARRLATPAAVTAPPAARMASASRLFGMDPAGDYIRLTREMPGRRINLAIPEESPPWYRERPLGPCRTPATSAYTPEVPVQPVRPDRVGQQRRAEWIRQARCRHRHRHRGLSPGRSSWRGPAARQQITVRATYSDGTDRDVTALALFMSNNDPDGHHRHHDGLVTSADRGAAFMSSRGLMFTAPPTQVLVIPEKLQYERPQARGDQLRGHPGQREPAQAPHPCPRASARMKTIVRRAYIDVVGQLPEALTR
jgi:hypothetical protein